MVLAAIALAGCAELPPCQNVQARIIQTEDGELLLGFDTRSMAAWMDAVRKQALGECVFRRKGAEL